MLPEQRRVPHGEDRYPFHDRQHPLSIMDWLPVMPALRACPVRLTATQHRILTRRARGHKTAHRDRVRAQIVLDAAAGRANAAIARRRGVGEDTVRKWRGRFAADGLAGLADRPRSGRPPGFTPVQVAEVKALACQLPAQAGAPLSRWSSSELARHAVQAGVVETISVPGDRTQLVGETMRTMSASTWASLLRGSIASHGPCGQRPRRTRTGSA